jgi:hypothetical protein
MALQNPFSNAALVAKKLKLLFFGAPGSGKTLAALSFPRVALVDAESGADLYTGRSGVAPFQVMRTKTVADLEHAVAFIRDDKGKTFDTLVIDPITVFYDVLKEGMAKTAKNNELGFREWSKVNTRMKSLYTQLTNLPVHTILIARESYEYETTNGQLTRTGIKPDADKSLSYAMDFVVRLLPDHSGTVIKSRGQNLPAHLPSVNWSVFEPFARAYADGERVQQQDEIAAADSLADEWTPDAVNAWIASWAAQGVSQEALRAALGVARWSEWTGGRAAADEAVRKTREQLASTE